MPMFPGGVDSYFVYLKNHLVYPSLAFKSEREGRVNISFVVDTFGKLTKIQILKPLGLGCDEAAIKFLEGMPLWTPGVDNGKKVPVLLNIPIEFKIDAYYNRFYKEGKLIYRDEKVVPEWIAKTSLQEFLTSKFKKFNLKNSKKIKYYFELNIKINDTGSVMEVLYTKSQPASYNDVKDVFIWLTNTLKNQTLDLWRPAQIDGTNVNATYIVNITL